MTWRIGKVPFGNGTSAGTQIAAALCLALLTACGADPDGAEEGVSALASELIVNVHNEADDVWRGDARLNISYCVSTERRLIIRLPDYDWLEPEYDLRTSAGTFIQELGHVLGFRHCGSGTDKAQSCASAPVGVVVGCESRATF